MNAMSGVEDRRSHAVASLTAPGARFETVDEVVCGQLMSVFRNRPRSLHEILAGSAAHGDAEYLVFEDTRLTFADHLAAATSLGEALRRDFAIEKGDRVAILSANNPHWILTFWAVTSIGGIAVAMNSMWSADEIAYGLALTSPKMIVADAPRRQLLHETDVPVIDIETDIAALSITHPGMPLGDCPVTEDDPAVILFTSGTSGRPKGVTHSHRNIITANEFHRFNDAVAAELGAPAHHRRFLLCNPLFHIASLHNLAVPRMSIGDTAVIHSGRFDIDKVLGLIERERVTNWGAVPTMASRLVAHEDLSRYDLSSLRVMSLGSAPSSGDLKSKVRRCLPVAGRALGTTYGLTESSTAATLATAADLEEYPESVGRPIVTMSIEIRDKDGRRVEDGSEGEICLRGPHIMVGYWNDDEATASAIDGDGWLHTGDIGVMANGHLRVSGRRSDLILRGGENVYPAEVEHVLGAHPAVRECAVLGVPDADYGEAVAAVVVVDEHCHVTQEQFRAHVAGRIAKYKVPSRWYVTTEPLVRNATGKVIRRLLEVGARG